MNPRKFIPKPVFLVYMAISLLAIVILWGTWLWRDAGPYVWLRSNLLFLGRRESQIVGALLAFVFLFVIWMLPTFALRHFSDMPPMGLGDAQDFRAAWDAQRQKRSAMLEKPADAAERVRYFRYFGLAGLGLGSVALLLAWIVWYSSGALWTEAFVFALVSLVAGLLAVLTGRPFIFDISKINNIQVVVQKIVWVVIIMVLVFASGMCLISMFD